MDARYLLQRVVNRFGYRIERTIPSDVDPQIAETIRRVAPFTKTTAEAVAALCAATAYIVKAEVPGDIVECGVWRGGSMMAAALTLRRLRATDRTLWLYDTYAGMAAPNAHDIRAWDGAVAANGFDRGFLDNGAHGWAYASLDLVQANMGATGYPADRVRFVRGKVEETIPGTVPDQIALLRLDTDFHDSTRHELEHLYPRLAHGGVLVLDDYGGWLGARKAVDDYVAEGNALHLVRVDPTVHVAVKP